MRIRFLFVILALVATWQPTTPAQSGSFFRVTANTIANPPQTSTSTGTVNAFAVTRSYVRLNNASDLTINGIAAGVDGQVVTFQSIGAGHVFFTHNSGSASSGNKLQNFATSGPTPLAAGVGTATYRYDGTSALWRLVSHEQGDFITPAFSAGDYVAINPGTTTWTVESGDVITMGYFLTGRQLSVIFNLSTTSIASQASGTLTRTLFGYTTSNNVQMPIRVFDNSTTASDGIVAIAASATVMRWLRPAFNTAAVWTNSTNQTGMLGEISVGVQ